MMMVYWKRRLFFYVPTTSTCTWWPEIKAVVVLGAIIIMTLGLLGGGTELRVNGQKIATQASPSRTSKHRPIKLGWTECFVFSMPTVNAMIVRLSTVYEKTKLIRLICEALVPLMILTLLMNFSHKCEATSQQKKDSIFSQITDENNSFLSVGPNQRRSDPVIKLMTSKFRRKSRQLESHSEPHQIHRHRYHHDTHSNNKSLKLQPSLQKQSILQVSPEKPIHILFPLPTESGRHNENPFGITIALAKPVVDEALDEVRRRKLVPINSLVVHFEDSKPEKIADNRREYKLMTRISSPYKVVKDAVISMFHRMEWKKSAYVFHEQRHDNTNPSIPYGECYLLMASLQPHLYRINKMEHNYFMFNQFTYNNEKMKDNLMKASMLSNGGAFLRLNFERPKYAVA